MTAQAPRTAPPVNAARTVPAVSAGMIPASATVRYVSAALRFSLGWIFLWTFLDKLFGLGHATKSAAAWIHGGSPTQGFLLSTGPFKSFYTSIAGSTWADWLFMIGLAAIGTALVLGVAMRIAAGAGVLLLVILWSVVLPPANNLFMDEHIVYALVLILLAAMGAGSFVGLGQYWERLAIVQRYPFLK